MRLEPTNLKNTNLGGFWNFAYMSESCGWENGVTPFRKVEMDQFLQHFSEYLRERPYLTLDPDTVNVNIPDLSLAETRYLKRELENIIRKGRCDR